MPLCVGVAFKRVAKAYWFDPQDLDLDEEDRVIVETTRGTEIGTVKIGPRMIVEDEIQGPLKRVVRKALAADLIQERQNREKARRAMAICVAAPTSAVALATGHVLAGGEAEDFTGPRSPWGARIARAVHAAVLVGATAYREKLGQSALSRGTPAPPPSGPVVPGMH